MKLGFEQSKAHGPQARQFVVLFDMAGFNVKQYTWRPGESTYDRDTRANDFIVIFMITSIACLHNYLHTFYCMRINFLAAEVVISLIKSYEANYPEILKCCYIINGIHMILFACDSATFFFLISVRLKETNFTSFYFITQKNSAEGVCHRVQYC